MGLKKCLLNELKQSEDGSGVTSSGIDYDESLYVNMKRFWNLFSTGQLKSKVTCTTCGTCSVMEEPFEELLLYFPEDHHTSDQDCTVENLIAHHCGTQDIDNYQCDICNGRTLATKVIAISTCPPILCIVLGRKKQDGSSIGSSVQFPVSGFNITEDALNYNLVGTIHHKPRGPDHGHYTSICQSQRSQSHKWFLYNDDSVSISNFTTRKNDRVLKPHTKSATILFYVSGALPTCIGSRDAIIDLQDDRTSCSPPEDNEDGTGDKGGGEEDAAPSSSSESELNNRERRGEDDESVLDYRISQEFLQRVEGHYCSICREQHYLTLTDLATFETEAQCDHVYCYIGLSLRKMASGNGNLTCPECNCIASDIIHHQPIRLDQDILGRSKGHFCSICHEDCFLRDTDLGTMDITPPCSHIFCYSCLLRHKSTRIEENQILKCPYCNTVAVDIIRHERRPLNEVEEVEVITDEPTDCCCDWAMDTTSSTGIGNPHEERCICPLVPQKLRNCHHEGCNKRVHRRCQEDWLDRHCYPWTREDPHFCREHNEHYIRWVRFKGGEIPPSEHGCVEGSFLNPRAENQEEPEVQIHE